MARPHLAWLGGAHSNCRCVATRLRLGLDAGFLDPFSVGGRREFLCLDFWARATTELGTWMLYILMSSRRVAAGFVIASMAGVTFGLLLGWYALINDLFDSLVNFLRAIPTTAWVPFTVFFFGIHESAAIFLIAFGTFFPITMNVAAGARQTPRMLIRAALMLGTPSRKLIWYVVLPATLPSVFAGLRIGLGLAWVLVIVSEMLAVQGGLGYALWSAYQVNRLDLIVDAIISVGLLGLISDWLLVRLSSVALGWQRGLVGQ